MDKDFLKFKRKYEQGSVKVKEEKKEQFRILLIYLKITISQIQLNIKVLSLNSKSHETSQLSSIRF